MSRTRTQRILIALTSHDDLGGVRATGYYLSEAAHPWKVFVDAGYRVDLVSVAGGTPPVDGADLSDPIQRAFSEDSDMQHKARNTPRFAEVDPMTMTRCSSPAATAPCGTSPTTRTWLVSPGTCTRRAAWCRRSATARRRWSG